MEETLQTRQEPSKPRRVSPAVRSVMEWVETIVMAVVLVAVVFTFVARVITVDGVSMEPTYYNGDRVLVTKLAGQAQHCLLYTSPPGTRGVHTALPGRGCPLFSY